MIKFRNIKEAEFEKYKQYSIKDYAENLIRSASKTKKNALESAINEFNSILPDGLKTSDNYMYVIENQDENSVGIIWYGADCDVENSAFIFDFFILDNYRNKGYGTAALLEVEKDARVHGYDKIGLNVFNFNEGAHSLYERCGYKPSKVFEANTIMEKEIC